MNPTQMQPKTGLAGRMREMTKMSSIVLKTFMDMRQAYCFEPDKTPIPKTGLASRMREWMKAQSRPFTKRDVYLGLGIEDPADRSTLRNAVPDFERRGEIILQPPDKRIRRQDLKRYRYNHTWQGAQKGALKPRIFKAMYVSGTFAVTDIQRLCDLDRAWIDKVVRRLRRSGHLAIVGRRLCAHGAGAEALYHVADRDKFRLEVMR